MIAQGISSGELIDFISSKEPHSAQKQLREAINNLQLNDVEEGVRKKYIDCLLVNDNATQLSFQIKVEKLNFHSNNLKTLISLRPLITARIHLTKMTTSTMKFMNNHIALYKRIPNYRSQNYLLK